MIIKGYADQNKYHTDLQSNFKKLLCKDELGYLKLPSSLTEKQQAKQWASDLKSKGIEQLAIIGMGGSYLGSKAIFHALSKEHSDLIYFNSSDPESFLLSTSQIKDPQKCHFLVISKSGSTVETLMLTNLIVQLLDAHNLKISNSMTIITEDRASALNNFAKHNKVKIFFHPKDVGGRYSVFSVVGLFPLAFAGINIDQLLDGCKHALDNPKNVYTFCSEALCSFDRGEWVTIFWPYKDSMFYWCEWVLQLWAESLGKQLDRDNKPAKRVSMPTYCIGSISQHSILQNILEGSKDKFVIFLGEDKNSKLIQASNQFPEVKWLDHDMGTIFQSQQRSTIESLEHFKISHLEITLPTIDAEQMGRLMMLMQLSIGLLGEVLNIDVYNQPSVEIGKQLLQKKMNSTI